MAGCNIDTITHNIIAHRHLQAFIVEVLDVKGVNDKGSIRLRVTPGEVSTWVVGEKRKAHLLPSAEPPLRKHQDGRKKEKGDGRRE